MRPPLRLIANGLGELSSLMDSTGKSIAHCVEPEDALILLNIINEREALRSALAESNARIEEIKGLLRDFKQTTEWHTKRKRLIYEKYV